MKGLKLSGNIFITLNNLVMGVNYGVLRRDDVEL